MTKVCPKGHEYPDYHPYCDKAECLTFEILGIIKPPQVQAGTFTYVRGFKYPYRGYPDPHVVGQNATVKRGIMATTRLLSKSPFRYALPFFFLLPPFLKRKALTAGVVWLSEIYEADFEKKQIPDNEFSEPAREIIFSWHRLIAWIDDDWLRKRFSKAIYCVTMIWEFDSAYRFRGQDIFAELNVAALEKNPRREIIRLMNILISRETPDTSQIKKDKIIKMLLNAALFLSPMVRNIIKRMILELDPVKMRITTEDKYFMADRFDYAYGGQSYEQRIKFREKENEGWTQEIPPANTMANITFSPNNYFFRLTPKERDSLLENARKQLIAKYDEKVKGGII